MTGIRIRNQQVIGSSPIAGSKMLRKVRRVRVARSCGVDAGRAVWEERVTLDEALAATSRAIDKVLEQRWDALAFQLIADGVQPDDGEDEPPPSEGPWQRLTFNQVLQRQRALDLEWRDATLAQLRINWAKISASN
jgi:hypothetical protein